MFHFSVDVQGDDRAQGEGEDLADSELKWRFRKHSIGHRKWTEAWTCEQRAGSSYSLSDQLVPNSAAVRMVFILFSALSSAPGADVLNKYLMNE